MIFIPASSTSSSSVSVSVPCPPPNISPNTISNCFSISRNRSMNCFLIDSVSSVIIVFRSSSAWMISSLCFVRNSYLSESSLYSSIAPTFTSPKFLISDLSFMDSCRIVERSPNVSSLSSLEAISVRLYSSHIYLVRLSVFSLSFSRWFSILIFSRSSPAFLSFMESLSSYSFF